MKTKQQNEIIEFDCIEMLLSSGHIHSEIIVRLCFAGSLEQCFWEKNHMGTMKSIRLLCLNFFPFVLVFPFFIFDIPNV